MSFTMGRDLGIVMAKGVLLGVIGSVTVLPSLILILDKPLQKTKHRPLIPNPEKMENGILKIFPVFLIIFVLLIPPAYYGYRKTNSEVYYDMANACLRILILSLQTQNSVRHLESVRHTWSLSAVRCRRKISGL